jgi:hypothetical protein
MDDKFLTDAVASVRERLIQLTALLEPTMDHDFVMMGAVANVRGHLIHLESLLETDDEHQTTSHGDFPDTTPGDRRDDMDTPLTETRPPHPPDQNPPWYTHTIATPTTALSVISPAHYLDIETYADAVHRQHGVHVNFLQPRPSHATPSPTPVLGNSECDTRQHAVPWKLYWKRTFPVITVLFLDDLQSPRLLRRTANQLLRVLS